MKLSLSILVLSAACAATAQVTFGTLQNVVGSGSFETGLVVQWETGASARALAWGFRHDGTATVADMVAAIVAADPALYNYTEEFSFGRAIYGVGYDADRSGVVGVGYVTGATPDDATPLDPQDPWRAGWLSAGYWSLWNAPAAAAPGGWAEAPTGISDQTLTSGGWHALAFAPSSNGWTTAVTPGIDAAPVPEPVSLAVIGLGLACVKRRRKA